MTLVTPPRRTNCLLAILVTVAAATVSAPLAMGQESEAHSHEIARLGHVTFPVSCRPESRRRFEHAMAVLHSFWWEEGERAFSAVLEADSACAMAYWGLALNAWGNPFAGGPVGPALARGAEAARRATSQPSPSLREQGFIAAAAALYRDPATSSNATRLQAYADTMQRLYRDLPRDTEVAIYYSLALLATAPRTDTTFAQQKRAAAILDPLFARYPNHPGLAHYLIHATDSPRLARLGLNAARRYAQIAPEAPHAEHMPSHIFVRLGLWDETIASNWRSYRASTVHAKAPGPAGAVSMDYYHALDYAVYAYLQEGRDSAARATVALAHDKAIPTGINPLINDYNRTAMAARVPLERGDWSAAAAFPVADSGVTMGAALSHFTRGLGVARSRNPVAARAEIAALDAMATEFTGRQEKYWARVVLIKRDAVEAWARFALGDTTAALALARAAADTEDVTDKHPVTPAELLPARELEADMLLAAGRYQDARQAYRATLTREPRRARSVFGAARAAELAGERDTAVSGYREFLRLMGKSDGDREELSMAKAFLRQPPR
jgi:hypothetical protein